MAKAIVGFGAVIAVCSSPSYGQDARGDFIDNMRAVVGQSKTTPSKDRCSLGVQVGDGGRVLLAFGASGIVPGNIIKSVNGVSIEGRSAEDFTKVLEGLPSSAVARVEVARAGFTSVQQLQCSSYTAIRAPITAAQEAAARKDFAKCVSELQRLPAALLGHWYSQYLLVNCLSHSKAISKEAEVSGVHKWADALIQESAYIKGQRDTAGKRARLLSGYFSANGRPDLGTTLTAAVEKMYEAAGEAQPAEPDWAKFRNAAEQAVRSRLIDPGSAQFEWPFGFTYGTWKPFLGKRVEGYWSCGQINARNRMGGYTGATYFVVVMDEPDNVKFVDLGSGKEYDLVDTACAKSVSMLPPAPAALAQAAPVSSGPVSVADEIEKLAALRDRGILTQAEFEAQKAALLAGVK